MSDLKERRLRTTVIYVALSAGVFLFGVALTVWGSMEVSTSSDIRSTGIAKEQRSPVAFSVGTSLLAAGLASLGFAVVRVFDDRDTNKLNEDVCGVKDRVDDVKASLLESRDLVRRTRIVIPTAPERCLFDSGISNRFREAVRDYGSNAGLEVDVVGLKLHRFLNDQMKYLTSQAASRDVRVRMLLQDPDTPDFGSICSLETRDEKGTRNSILLTLKQLQGAKKVESDLQYTSGRLIICLRFYPQFQPIAFFRVNDTVLVRPRIRSNGAGDRFYETYTRQEGEEYFGLYRDHFQICWEKSKFLVPSTIAQGMNGMFEL